ncbi:TadA family conjugal transfer-associated ATPase [uncultured Schumannella sp.]|uniref:TadA family conjugal transfer-associated ATPase n=1 Tax=uncultured Schumannella sp. TaxID=1195956 RepID=UPI0025D37327|nr:TadA family conjugal transfer-associated ATPase [uncultured Schumannella sp.]
MDAWAGEQVGPFVARPSRAATDRGLASPARTAADASVWGPLAGVLEPEVTDLFVNPDGSVWVDRGTGAEAIPGLVLAPREARELAVRLLARGDRHVDEATPCADVALDDTLRVHAVLPPISGGGAVLSIRQARPERWSLAQLAERGVVDPAGLERLRELVARRANLLVTGAAGTGKTTLLAALLAEAPATERLVVLEDVAELRVAHPHVVALSARQPNLEGRGAVGLDRLVREALRMRPDRLIVGECRGAELRELLTALNTGHDGGAGTLHANSLADVPARLEALGAVAGLGPTALARQAVSAFDAVIHVARGGVDVPRRVESFGRLRLGARDRLAVEEW